MNDILAYLAAEEGIEVHRNSGESDITAPYGIYRAVHPEAEIFEFIDELATMLDIHGASADWTHSSINTINILMSEYREDIKALAAKFYQEYLKDAHLQDFPEECIVSMYSIFTTSPLLAWKSVQKSINAYNSTQGNTSENHLVVDGLYGIKTKTQLQKIKYSNDGYYFETLILLNMATFYAELASKNPEKYLKFLNGWNNRLKRLSEV